MQMVGEFGKMAKTLNFIALCTEYAIGIERACWPGYTEVVEVGHGG